jgi:2-oxoisovalerate dehydrogenase E1 component alpha subunit
MSALINTLSSSLSSIPLRTLYAHILLTRLVDEHLHTLCQQGYIENYPRCLGHEAAQVGSAICISVGQDFTLPYYRDLGVVLTIGMTPYEAIRTYLDSSPYTGPATTSHTQKQPLQWGNSKRNIVHGSVATATHILHAAGIAFSSKLRKAAATTIAYCGDGATSAPDFQEGMRFAAQHHLPVIFLCEQACAVSPDTSTISVPSCFDTLPSEMMHQRVDGMDVVQVYEAMRRSVEQVRNGEGPILLELAITRTPSTYENDALLRCEQYLKTQSLWDETWATQLHTRLRTEIEQAAQSVLLDVQQPH